MIGHKKTHTKEKPYVCDWRGCGKAFSKSSNLIAHKKTHTKERPFPCDWPGCGKAFSEKGTLVKHKKTHTNASSIAKGPRAGRLAKILLKAASVVDKKTRANKRPFVCDWPGCERTFAHKSYLVDHKKTHTKERPFSCDWPGCGKAFARISRLDDHKKVHTKERPFLCDWPGCGKAFSRRNCLTDHKRTHTKEKPYSCDWPGCKKTFGQRYSLVSHEMRTHTKDTFVRQFLESEFEDYKWTFDRAFAVGTLKSPDARLAIGKTHIVIVEVDQESYDVYDCSLARAREKIFKESAPKGATVVLIRFNPDAYTDVATGNRIPSCFRYSQEKSCVTVDPSWQEQWETRISVLRSWIQHFIDFPPCMVCDEDGEEEDLRYKYVFPVELFYDNVQAKYPNGNQVKMNDMKRAAKDGKRKRGETGVDASFPDPSDPSDPSEPSVATGFI